MLFCSENEEMSERNQAMASALATILKYNAVQLSGQNGQALERCQSFIARDKKIWKEFGRSTNKKVWKMLNTA